MPPALRRPSVQPPCIYPSIRSSIRPSIHLSIHPSIYPPVHPSIYLSDHLSIRPSIHPSVHPSNQPSIETSIFVGALSFMFLDPSFTPPSIHPCMKAFSGPSIRLSGHMSSMVGDPSKLPCAPPHPSVSSSIHPSAHLPNKLFMFLPIHHLSIHPPIHPCIGLIISPPNHVYRQFMVVPVN